MKLKSNVSFQGSDRQSIISCINVSNTNHAKKEMYYNYFLRIPKPSTVCTRDAQL